MSRSNYEEYFNYNVRNILQNLTLDILKKQPEEPIPFMISWLQRSIEFKSNQKKEKFDNSDQELQEENQFEQKKNKVQLKNKFPAKQRTSISAQAFGRVNQLRQFKPKVIEKNENERSSIKNILKKSFLFNTLSNEALNTVIDCMKKKSVKKGQYVIKQGEIGNQIYIVSQGTLTCQKKFNINDEKDTFLKYYKSGQSFGELALLYYVPRQASIIANQNCQLWELDREIFNNVVRDSVIRQKSHIRELLKTVNLFENMSNSELQKLVQSVKVEQYEANQYVCKEGDSGEHLFIVDKGYLIAEKKINDEVKKVYQYQAGTYFGEIALVCSTTRKASIKCIQKSILLTLGRNQFERLVGLNQKLLKDFSKYQGLTMQ